MDILGSCEQDVCEARTERRLNKENIYVDSGKGNKDGIISI